MSSHFLYSVFVVPGLIGLMKFDGSGNRYPFWLLWCAGMAGYLAGPYLFGLLVAVTVLSGGEQPSIAFLLVSPFIGAILGLVPFWLYARVSDIFSDLADEELRQAELANAKPARRFGR